MCEYKNTKKQLKLPVSKINIFKIIAFKTSLVLGIL